MESDPLKRVKRYVIFRLRDFSWVRLQEIDAVPSSEANGKKDRKIHFLDLGMRDLGVQYAVAAIDISGVQGAKSKPISASVGK